MGGLAKLLSLQQLRLTHNSLTTPSLGGELAGLIHLSDLDLSANQVQIKTKPFLYIYIQISTRCPLFSRLVNRTHHAHTRSLLTSSAATHLRTQKTKQHSVCTVSTHLSSLLCPTPRDVDGTLSALSLPLSLSPPPQTDCWRLASR